MRALVTGGTGFIGSHLARCLVEENVDVRNTGVPRGGPRGYPAGRLFVLVVGPAWAMTWR